MKLKTNIVFKWEPQSLVRADSRAPREQCPASLASLCIIKTQPMLTMSPAIDREESGSEEAMSESSARTVTQGQTYREEEAKGPGFFRDYLSSQ